MAARDHLLSSWTFLEHMGQSFDMGAARISTGSVGTQMFPLENSIGIDFVKSCLHHKGVVGIPEPARVGDERATAATVCAYRAPLRWHRLPFGLVSELKVQFYMPKHRFSIEPLLEVGTFRCRAPCGTGVRDAVDTEGSESTTVSKANL
ncbi:hypothetical protein PF010_g28496 [Phytophthora fragariae]|uniref:Uncharacterized protein n=1 Tax=Phytophthora fragariae TaxID=53985 RepID=A0A6G0JRR4_9STRA|nr:hypothetical protein PF010_g28496 [Phytophthora fragariae]